MNREIKTGDSVIINYRNLINEPGIIDRVDLQCNSLPYLVKYGHGIYSWFSKDEVSQAKKTKS